MREILFRGKREDGVWMDGGLFMHNPVRVCFSAEKKPAEPMIITDGFCDWGFEPPMMAAKVIPETVGQFTGLTDKNGKKIFEGDIIKYITPENLCAIGEVKFGEYGTVVTCGIGFFIVWRRPSEAGWLRQDIGFWAKFREIEVVGNIHDNPVLLEV